jgi:hypothetical protein
MMHRHNPQGGFHLVGLIVVLLIAGVVGFVGYTVANRTRTANQITQRSTMGDAVKWVFNQQKLQWAAEGGTPPTCKDPFVFNQSPVDLSQLMVIGMPGTYRGYNYKPHGGMRLSNPESGKVEVRMPTDATLVGLTRYYEGNPAELQYLLTFETSCGIAFRFDHLYTLAPAFQTIANTTPEPQKDNTRTNPNTPFKRTSFKASDLVATEVGFQSTKNFGFDFGVYDYRHRNQISKNQQWTALHNQYQSLEWFGTCWLEQLPGADAAKAKELGLTVINPAKPNISSDYCSYAPHTTLDFNNGKPTDG